MQETQAGSRVIELKHTCRAEARRKFDVEKKRFLEGARVGEVLAAAFDEWLKPELAERDDDGDPRWKDDDVEVYISNAGYLVHMIGQAFHQSNCAYLAIKEDSTNAFLVPVGPYDEEARAACAVLLANTPLSVLRTSDSCEVSLVRRAWMSVARATWIATVVRSCFLLQ